MKAKTKRLRHEKQKRHRDRLNYLIKIGILSKTNQRTFLFIDWKTGNVSQFGSASNALDYSQVKTIYEQTLEDVNEVSYARISSACALVKLQSNAFDSQRQRAYKATQGWWFPSSSSGK